MYMLGLVGRGLRLSIREVHMHEFHFLLNAHNNGEFRVIKLENRAKIMLLWNASIF